VTRGLVTDRFTELRRQRSGNDIAETAHLVHPSPKLRCGSVFPVQRWVFATVCLSLAVCRGQEGPLATFGTTVVIPGGLTGKIYHIPFNSSSLPNFDKLEPLGTIYARGLYIPPREFTEGFPGITDRIEWFAIDFTGRFYIANPGKYFFSLCSDDGSKLYFDGKVAIDNDGAHATVCQQNSVALSGGIHSIRLSYFQGPRYHLSLMLAVAGPKDKFARPFNTDEFRPPANPEDWKYGSPDALTVPVNPDAGRTSLRDVLRREDPMVSLPVQVLSHDRPVPGLTQADFVVRDQGEPQAITGLTFEEQPLDVVLLFDASPAMAPYMKQVNATAQRTLSRLDPHDRVAVVLFGEKLNLTMTLALNRDLVAAAIRRIQPGEGPRDLNGAIALTANYLRDHARPDAATAIVILTGNEGIRGVPDSAARDALWQTNIILSGLLVKANDPPKGADVRPFIQASGGEIRYMDPKNVPLAELLGSLRARYRINYRMPGGTSRSIRNISVELTPEAQARLGDITLRTPGGYVVP